MRSRTPPIFSEFRGVGVEPPWYATAKQDRQCMYNVTLRRTRATIVAVGMQLVLHFVRVCFVALVNQHAMRMRHIVICGLPRST